MPQTVFLTGSTGYLAKHILVRLLNDGYAVRGSLRNMARADEVRDEIRPHLSDTVSLDALTFVELDLTRDAGWEEALKGTDILMHTASPFPFTQPKNEDELIVPAVQGTLRALKAAQGAGIKRIILTSSTAAISGAGQGGSYDETNWTDVTSKAVTPYVKSKTLAEQAAWDFVTGTDITLTAVNPGFIVGPSLDHHYGTSLRVFERILAGKDPAVPRLGFSTVDVRDVADIHVAAIDNDAIKGHRVAAVANFLWFSEIAETLKSAFPDRKITTREAPNFLMKIMGMFDPAIKQLIPALSQRPEVSNKRAREVLGHSFRPLEPALVESAQCVISAKA